MTLKRVLLQNQSQKIATIKIKITTIRMTLCKQTNKKGNPNYP